MSQEQRSHTVSGQRGDFSDDAARWAAVVRREANADGQFVFAVRTTGVFCRPSCASRAPRRDNVAFFATPRDAQRAGFRACKRCRPDLPDVADERAQRIAMACRWLEQADEEPPLAALARAAGMSPFHFQRTFKALVGLSPKQYARARRFDRLRANLRNGQRVTQAIYAAGFRAPSRAYEHAAANLAMTPSVYRRGGAGALLDFSVRKCPLGWVLVAGTSAGAAFIALGDDPIRLQEELRREFPRAALRENGGRARSWARAVTSYLERPARGLTLPLDLFGTDFQLKVWSALARIPRGTTMSYGELAASLGMPRAVRAVGAACAANRLAVAVPCHRVLGREGRLTGYRWGTERKQRLLDVERQAITNGERR